MARETQRLGRALLLLGPVLLACGQQPTTRSVTEIDTELLFHRDRLEVLDQVPDQPVRVGHIRPARPTAEALDPDEAPSLLLAPIARVAFEVTEATELDAAFGIDGRSCRALGPQASLDLAWSVSVNGVVEAAGQATLTRTASGIGGWSEVTGAEGQALRLGPGDRVELGTTSADPVAWAALGEAAPLVGFGRLRLLTRNEVPIARATPERPNVVLVVMDTLRGDRTSVGGYGRPTTPHLAELAARGTSYTSAFATSSWTWPSTGSLLTGLLPEEHGVEEPGASYLFGELDTLAELYQRAGAATAAFVGNRLISAPHNFDQGFQHFDAPARSEFVDSDVLVPAAIDWLDEHTDERFFLYLHLVDPHRPYQPDVASVAALPAARPDGFHHVRPEERFRELWLEANDQPAGGRDRHQLPPW
ncbi:MAG: sulfatase-like hydrolase/transferase, partial [Planctomycetota bacterium]|nr:sulfatase-like hydrolase/transferase [Planctomycetota bacterium]